MKLASSVVEQAQPGEGMEVYVTRGTENEVRAYDGAVESLTSADSSGVGIRVVLDGPEGRGAAWASPGPARSIRPWCRPPSAMPGTTPATPPRTPTWSWQNPTGVSPVEQDLWDDGVITTPMDDKIALALELERATRAADPRVRQVSSADYSDGRVEVALASTTGIRSEARRTTAFLSVDAIAGEGADSQTGTGFSVGRSPAQLDPEVAMAEAVLRSTRLLGAQKARSGRCTVVFDPRVVSTLLSVVASALSGEAVVKGRSFFAGRIGESVAKAGVTLTDDPTDSRAFSAASYDGEGSGLPAQRPDLGRQCSACSSTTRSRPGGRRPARRAPPSGAASRAPRRPGAGPWCSRPGRMSADEVLALVGEGLYVQSVTGIHSGVNPVSGDFSVGAEGLMIKGGSLAEPVREVTVASTLQRMLQSVVAIGGDLRWLPGVAAGQTLAIGDMQLSGD
jgi:PmbA protein